MLRFHSRRGWSPRSARAEAMPALETRMSTPPNSLDRAAEAPRDRRLVGHVERGRACTRSRPRRLPQRALGLGQARPRRCRRARRRRPRASSRSRRRPADAAGAAGDQRDPAGQRPSASACAAAWPPRAASTRCRRPPAPAGRHSGRRRRRAAHHVDGVDVELGRRSAPSPCPGEGDHADAGDEIDDRRWGRASPGCRHACSARSSRHSPRGRPRSPSRPVERRVDVGVRRVEVDDQRPDLGAQEMVGAGGAERRQLAPARFEFDELEHRRLIVEMADLALACRDHAADRRHQPRARRRARSAAGSDWTRAPPKAACRGRWRRASRWRALMMRERRLVAGLGVVAPGEQAVARRARTPLGCGLSAANRLQPEPELEARPLPGQPADLVAEDLPRQLLRVASTPRWR